jgi:hypothetical protein
MLVLTMQLVSKVSWFEDRFRHLKIYINNINHKSGGAE